MLVPALVAVVVAVLVARLVPVLPGDASRAALGFPPCPFSVTDPSPEPAPAPAPDPVPAPAPMWLSAEPAAKAEKEGTLRRVPNGPSPAPPAEAPQVLLWGMGFSLRPTSAVRVWAGGEKGGTRRKEFGEETREAHTSPLEEEFELLFEVL